MGDKFCFAWLKYNWFLPFTLQGNIKSSGKVTPSSEETSSGITQDSEANKHKTYTITEKKNGYQFAHILFAMLITLVHCLDVSYHKNAIMNH